MNKHKYTLNGYDRHQIARCVIYWAIIIGFIGAGIYLITQPTNRLEYLSPISTHVPKTEWTKFVGVLFISIGFSQFIIDILVKFVDFQFGLGGEHDIEDTMAPRFLGIMEGFLFPIAIIIKRYDFIGLWLTYKVAALWVGWGVSGQVKVTSHRNTSIKTRRGGLSIDARKGRRRFIKFLIGNGLRIICSIATIAVFRFLEIL